MTGIPLSVLLLQRPDSDLVGVQRIAIVSHAVAVDKIGYVSIQGWDSEPHGANQCSRRKRSTGSMMAFNMAEGGGGQDVQ
jgi:hypothetical protein